MTDLDALEKLAREAQKKTRMITAERVREKLIYERETGVFRWRNGRPGLSAGTIAGQVGTDGRRLICVDYRKYLEHRLAWLYVHGEWPAGEVDHINGDPLDNRIDNLRVVSGSENRQSILKPMATNKVGLRGVAFRPGRGYTSRFRLHGKVVHIGTFKTPEAAHSAYLTAKAAFHPAAIQAMAAQRPDALRSALAALKEPTK